MSGERQLELLAGTAHAWHPHPDRPDPVVWIREVLILKKLEVGEDNVIRRISLRTGLNILWARPSEESEPGLSGHATGKTTFCRILRFLLGEGSFGNEMVRDQIRHKFPNGHVAAEIMVDKVPWLVCRPFSSTQRPFAVRGETLTGLYSETLVRGTLQLFYDALAQSIINPMAVRTFASSGKDITWQHILPWLARDQEARFSDLTEWRHRLSRSDSPDPDSDDRNHMLRAVLGLIDLDEQDELRKHAILLREREDARQRLPLVEHQLKKDSERLRLEIPYLASTDLNALNLQSARRQQDAYIDSIRREIQSIAEDSTVEQLQHKWQEAQSAASRAQDRVTEVEDNLTLQKAELAVVEGKKDETELRKLRLKHRSSSAYCGVPLEVARAKGCRLAEDIPIDFSAATLDKLDGEAVTVHRTVVDRLQRELSLHQRDSAAKTEVARHALLVYNATVAARSKAINDMSLKMQAHTYTIKRIDTVVASQAEMDDLQKQIQEMDTNIERAYVQQEMLRKRLAIRRAEFSDTFCAVIRTFIGPDVTASADLSGRKISLEIEDRGRLTSAAIETIKVLAFDITALAASMEGCGWHPRFLIHDGPREADMQASVYYRLFLLGRELEESYQTAAPAFQYIITTTTPPPPDMQESSPWLIDPILSGSVDKRRLLGVAL